MRRKRKLKSEWVEREMGMRPDSAYATNHEYCSFYYYDLKSQRRTFVEERAAELKNKYSNVVINTYDTIYGDVNIVIRVFAKSLSRREHAEET